MKHAVIGLGRLARALVPALRATGGQVAVGRRVPGDGEFTPADAARQADWVWLTVPDDAIAATAAA
jgi:3-hydroxyisobutyrate dehydrogenase-like beta-hydroxyacid dehydrogenase